MHWDTGSSLQVEHLLTLLSISLPHRCRHYQVVTQCMRSARQCKNNIVKITDYFKTDILCNFEGGDSSSHPCVAGHAKRSVSLSSQLPSSSWIVTLKGAIWDFSHSLHWVSNRLQHAITWPRRCCFSGWLLNIPTMCEMDHIDYCLCSYAEMKATGQTCYLTQSQYTDTRPTSYSPGNRMPGAWQGSQ